jgi:VanZ family protein
MDIIDDYRTNWVLALVWIIFIFLLSSQSDLHAPPVFPAQDELAHLIVFGILGILFGRSFKPNEKPLSFKNILIITILVTVYGGVDEVHQIFVPNRHAEIGDLIADAVGGFLGGIVFYYLPVLHVHSPRYYAE